MNLAANIEQLCDELWNRSYTPLPSSCFIITYPKTREVFAAEFRDRIVHHLYYNYTNEMFGRTFIQDTYSCIPERGTHYGIARLQRHIRSASENFSKPCYVLKMDISGYFMHIDRRRLFDISLQSLGKMSSHRILSHSEIVWSDRIDMEFVEYLTRQIVMLDPSRNCRIVGSLNDWKSLPHNKSLFNMPSDTGLPIGNLTSQLFSNVYLNVFDQWIKRVMKCRYYGRYVDDFYIVSSDREWLRTLIPKISEFLRENLSLSIQQAKTMITSVYYGVSFLGAFIRPFRIYIDNSTLRHMRYKLFELEKSLLAGDIGREHLRLSLNSFLGVLGHYNSYFLRRKMMMQEHIFSEYGVFTRGITRFEVFMPESTYIL